jgi:hypothetical protein
MDDARKALRGTLGAASPFTPLALRVARKILTWSKEKLFIVLTSKVTATGDE